MRSDITYINGIAYRIMDRILIRYPCNESDEQRKARGDGAAPYVAYTSCRIERADEI